MEGWGRGSLIGGPVALEVSLGHTENNLPGHAAHCHVRFAAH